MFYRPRAIVLAIMGGGLLVSGAAIHRRNVACDQARATGQANAAELCTYRSSSSGGHGTGVWYGSGTTTSGASRSATAAPASTVSRGGFGASGAHFAAAGS